MLIIIALIRYLIFTVKTYITRCLVSQFLLCWTFINTPRKEITIAHDTYEINAKRKQKSTYIQRKGLVSFDKTNEEIYLLKSKTSFCLSSTNFSRRKFYTKTLMLHKSKEKKADNGQVCNFNSKLRTLKMSS